MIETEDEAVRAAEAAEAGEGLSDELAATEPGELEGDVDDKPKKKRAPRAPRPKKEKAERVAKKPAAPKKAKKTKSGASGAAPARRRMTPETANKDEIRVLETLSDLDAVAKIADIAKQAWPGKLASGDAEYEHEGDKGKAKPRKTPLSAYRRVANAVRRPVRDGLVKRPEVGHYQILAAGKAFLARVKDAG